MDIARYGLIASIAAVSLFIAYEWGEFSDAQHIAKTTSQSNYSHNADIPTAAVEVGNGDIPQVTVNASGDTITTTAPVSVADYVRVETPNLSVRISLDGGDIIYAALPQHQTSLEDDLGPFTLLEQNERRTFIAQSGLVGPNGTDTAAGRAHYSSADNFYSLAAGESSLSVDLTQQVGAVTITKRFSFSADSYVIKVEHIVDNNSSDNWSGTMFTQLRRDNSEDPGATSSGMGMKPYLGAATATADKPYEKIKFDKFDKFEKFSHSNTYIAMVQHYFVSAWISNPDVQVDVSTKTTANGLNLIRYIDPITTIAPGQQGVLSSQLYLGPKDQYTLETLAPGLDLTVDYGWLWMIAQPIFFCLYHLHKLLGNWGWSIIILTFGIKLLFFPLSAASYRSMAKMRKLTPKMQAIRDNYGHDKQRQGQEMMALYQKEKVNPLGGCLPILIQMPVFISLYWVLSESVELRHSPWLGWIQDLSSRDPYFILPLIMGASMFFQQKLNPPPPDPMQAKIMQIMPIMFTVFFLFFPAGLVLYWVVNNLLSIAQQWYITRQIEAQQD